MREKFSFLFLRRSLFVTLFATLITLAGISLFSHQASAGGTIPPGGTVPVGTLPPPSPAGQGQVNVLHLAPFGSVANSAVDVCTQAGVAVTGATNLHYLEQSGYLTLPAGNYDWKVTAPNCGATIEVDLAPFTLFDQAVLTIVLVGDGVNQKVDYFVMIQSNGFSLRQYAPLIFSQP